MESDGLGQVSIKRSLPKSIGLLALASLFVLSGIWMVYGGAVGTKDASTMFLGGLSVVFFGMASAIVLFRLIFGSNIPVILSQTGYVDKRLFKGEISWSEIVHASVISYRKTSNIKIELSPEAFRRLDLTWSAMIIHWMNKPFSCNAINITSNDLAISFPEFWSLMRKYVTEYCPHVLADDK
jgi:hypothetical protein